jgi:hypothetical protein
MAGQPELVEVWETQGIDLANIYKSKLEAAGIPVLLRYESASLVFGLTVDGIGRVHLLVPGAFAGDAEALLNEEVEWEEGDAEPGEQGPAGT